VTKAKVGLDAKWLPSAGTIVDATINPDFSQVESDVAQISANERFALFYPEKRPFFLEHLDLLQTPIQAVYTRTITSLWGARDRQGAAPTHRPRGRDRGGARSSFRVDRSRTPGGLQSFVGLARVGGPQRLPPGVRPVAIRAAGTTRFSAATWHANDADVVTGQYLWLTGSESAGGSPDVASDSRRLG
jgi:hypothetical protein